MKINQVKNLLETNKLEQKSFIESFDLILSDCDGNMYIDFLKICFYYFYKLRYIMDE